MYANSLTIIVMAVWIIMALWGFYRGAMRTVISISIIIISIAASVYISPKVNDMLVSSNTVSSFARGRADKFVETRIQKISDGDADLGWVEYLPLPAGVSDVIREGDPAVVGALLDTETVRTYLSELIAGFLIRLVSIIATFLLAYIAMFVARLVFTMIGEAPYISGLNRMAGLVLGVIRGAVIIWIVFAVIRVSGMMDGPGGGLTDQIKESEVLSMMYVYNPIFTMLPKLLGLLQA